MAVITQWIGETPEGLRQALRHDRGWEMRARRATVVVSLIGIASMAVTSLLQTGIVRHLPDPPLRNFHSDKVNTSDEAYSYGGPDSPITVGAHAANMVLAATGGADRAERHPWLPLLATMVAGAQAAIAAKYLFYQMPRVDKAWCPYCILDAFAHFASLGLILPEAGRALASFRRA
jgi:uncharacterized membrane protein